MASRTNQQWKKNFFFWWSIGSGGRVDERPGEPEKRADSFWTPAEPD